MGCIISCYKDQQKNYKDHLIQYRYCHSCKTMYISNIEYNKHIVNCNKVYGDM